MTLPDGDLSVWCYRNPKEAAGLLRLNHQRANEIDRLRGVLEQIVDVCKDNDTKACNHRMALRFVGEVAESAWSVLKHTEFLNRAVSTLNRASAFTPALCTPTENKGE